MDGVREELYQQSGLNTKDASTVNAELYDEAEGDDACMGSIRVFEKNQNKLTFDF